jgi:isoaspartyl peptidase/L-asparaginase-like protein (Ntn-hydrolase superfamily)
MDVLAHGGAGSTPAEPERRQAVLDRAAARGADRDGPEAAVVATIRALESDPRFNAGVGSAVQSDGVVRTEAGLMTGDGETGAACAMPRVEHAVAAARVVKRETPHVLLAGERAVSLAGAFGIGTDRDLWTPATRERWAEADPPVERGPPDPPGDEARNVRDQVAWVRDRFGADPPAGDHDTVGAVATERDRLAAATSTGGRWFALAGRVGDVPQVGGGFYATPAAAASATGAGEAIARFGLARRVVDAVESGETPGAAAGSVLAAFDEETGATAGVIVLGRDGRRGTAHSATTMQTARGSAER